MQDFNVAKIREEIECRRKRLELQSPNNSESPTRDTRWLAGELSSDQAGETGAVWIYIGALGAMFDLECAG